MKKNRLTGLIPALLTSLVAQAAPPADWATHLQHWLGESPAGVSAAWIDADGVVFAQAGKFSASDARPLSPDTYFEIGSITKVFTALLLADAVGQGKLSLDAPVGPPFAESGVTYRQLATHTAGLPALPPDLEIADSLNPYATSDLAALVRSFAKVGPTAKPAEASYSNFGFAVLGQAVAASSGLGYADALRARVLEPLALTDTFLGFKGLDASRIAPGHNETGVTPAWTFDAYAPAGALVSTARELAKFAQANLGLVETPLRPALDLAQTPAVASGKNGLAWVIQPTPTGTVLWHNGGTGGYRSFLALDRAQRRAVVLLTNQTRGLEPLGFALLAGKPWASRPPVEPAADALAGYLGSYPLAPNFVMTVTAEGEQLFLQATGQPRLKLRRVTPDRYAVVDVAAEVSFERDAGGGVVALVLHQNGAMQRAPRLKVGEKPAAPREIELSTEVLENYVGRYVLGPVEFTVTRTDNRLWVQLTGQPKAPVFASATDEFFYKIVAARIQFERDASGRVTALVLHQNGLAQRAVRR